MTKRKSTDQMERLVLAALDARGRAYAPYSNYHVGAALLTASGRIFGGCNVENASYGLSICAERSAVVSAVSAGERDFVAIAVATTFITSPCGACRQFLVEFNPDLQIILATPDGGRERHSAKTLLPHYFSAGNLDQSAR